MSSLPVVETFHSLQGEGLHAGRSAFFIRLGGCTVGCSWCDTKHSWPQTAHPALETQALAAEAAEAQQQGAAFVVITGGEPLHHNLDGFCQTLAEMAPTLPRHLETSGVDPLSGSFSWITLSPKAHKPPTQELLACCDELKAVVHGPEVWPLPRPWPPRHPKRNGCCSPVGTAPKDSSWPLSLCATTRSGA